MNQDQTSVCILWVLHVLFGVRVEFRPKKSILGQQVTRFLFDHGFAMFRCFQAPLCGQTSTEMLHHLRRDAHCFLCFWGVWFGVTSSKARSY